MTNTAEQINVYTKSAYLQSRNKINLQQSVIFNFNFFFFPYFTSSMILQFPYRNPKRVLLLESTAGQ